MKEFQTEHLKLDENKQAQLDTLKDLIDKLDYLDKELFEFGNKFKEYFSDESYIQLLKEFLEDFNCIDAYVKVLLSVEKRFSYLDECIVALNKLMENESYAKGYEFCKKFYLCPIIFKLWQLTCIAKNEYENIIQGKAFNYFQLPENQQSSDLKGQDLLPELWNICFNYLNPKELTTAELVCKYWNTQIGKKEDWQITKANKNLFNAIKKGNVERVKECLQKKANVNAKLSFNFLNLRYQGASFLHVIVRKRTFPSYFGHPSENDIDVQMFKLLIQHNIDIHHTPAIFCLNNDGKMTSVHSPPLGILLLTNPCHYDRDLAVLLSLRQNEETLQFNKITLLDFANIISNEYERNYCKIVKEYFNNIQENNIGLCYQFTEVEKNELLNNKKIKLIMGNNSSNRCALM